MKKTVLYIFFDEYFNSVILSLFKLTFPVTLFPSTISWQIHTGLQHGIIWAAQPNGLPLELPTIADKLREVGYATHAVGKWHLGFYKEAYTPLHRGFDSYYGKYAMVIGIVVTTSVYQFAELINIRLSTLVMFTNTTQRHQDHVQMKY